MGQEDNWVWRAKENENGILELFYLKLHAISPVAHTLEWASANRSIVYCPPWALFSTWLNYQTWQPVQ
jgi:hypothetical protein